MFFTHYYYLLLLLLFIIIIIIIIIILFNNKFILIFISVEGSCSAGGICEKYEHSCGTLFMCLVTVFKDGVKSGGGIGDVLRKPSIGVSVV